MIPMDDWMVLEKENLHKESAIVVPDSARDKTSIDVGDVFVATVLGPDVKERIKVGERLLFYGMATVMGLKLPEGKHVWVGRAQDVAFKLEKGE